MFRRHAKRLVALAVSAACFGAAHAQVLPDWATHNGNARHTGYVPVAMDPSNFGVRWSVTLPGGTAGYNPAATGAGAAYVSNKVWFATGHLFALDLATGTVIWSHEYTSPVHGGIPLMNAPAYRNGLAYVSTGGHEDAALWGYDAATGMQRFRAQIAAQWETYYSPTPFGNSMYMNGGSYGGAYSFRASDGAQTWFTELPQYSEWTPAVDEQYVYAYTTQLDLINRWTGRVARTIADPNFSWGGYSVGCAPVLGSRGNVLVTQGGRMVSFDIAAGQVAWEVPVTTGYYEINQLSLAGGQIYYGKGNTVEIRDEADGQLISSWMAPNGSTIESTVVLTKNLFFVSTSGGTYAVSRQNPRGWRWRTAAHGQLSLSSEGVLLIVATDGTVTAVQTRGTTPK